MVREYFLSVYFYIAKLLWLKHEISSNKVVTTRVETSSNCAVNLEEICFHCHHQEHLIHHSDQHHAYTIINTCDWIQNLNIYKVGQTQPKTWPRWPDLVSCLQLCLMVSLLTLCGISGSFWCCGNDIVKHLRYYNS